MAIIKHSSSKNARYEDVLEYRRMGGSLYRHPP